MRYEFKINSFGTASDITLTVKVDNALISRFWCDNQNHEITYIMDDEIDDVLSAHRFSIEMTGKNYSHTKIDNQGNRLSDCYFVIERLVFDDIDVTEEFCNGQSKYRHDNNGTSESFDDDFFGIIGCNGTVMLDFKTPLHIWMLDKCQ